jgi:lipopolysaccharide export system permease protein
VLSQFMVMFGFFALVLVSMFWINKAVRMFDRLVGDGQPAWVFLEFTALTLPGVIGMVLPLATFAAAVQVTNRLSTERELTVVQATGYSPLRLARPALVFGVIVALIMSLLSHLLIPLSLGELRQREAEVRQNVTARFLEDGKFLHPAPGITFYIGDITAEGELREVFLSDRRDPQRPVIYTSTRAYLVQDEAGAKLVMVNGMSQTMRRDGRRLYTGHFDDFSYNISNLIAQAPGRLDKVQFARTAELLRRPAAVMERTGASTAQLRYHLHTRFAQALICVVVALIGFAALLLGGYSRFGVWWQIVTAFLLLVVVKLAESGVTGIVLSNAAAWPLMYAPIGLGVGIAAVLLFLAARPWLVRGLAARRRDAGGAA